MAYFRSELVIPTGHVFALPMSVIMSLAPLLDSQGCRFFALFGVLLFCDFHLVLSIHS